MKEKTLKIIMAVLVLAYGFIFGSCKNCCAASNEIQNNVVLSSDEVSVTEKEVNSVDLTSNETVLKKENPKKNKNERAVITWFGHSMFLIELGGQRIVLDPFNEDCGYNVPKALNCDACVISHSHLDHSYTRNLIGAYQEFKREGAYNCGGVGIEQMLTYHDKENGKKRGENLVTVISYENFKIAHLGDLGHVLNDEQVRKLGKIDILMVPVGGYYTIDAFDAWEVIRLISPKIIIPMHYKTDRTAGNIIIDTIDKFAAGRKNVVNIDSNVYEVELSNIANDEKIWRFKVPE